MTSRSTSAIAILVGSLIAACAGRTVVIETSDPPAPALMAQLRVEPGPQARDLFWGLGGRRYAPPADARYALKEKDDTGFSVSYDVTSPDGTEWSAKIGAEAQSEVVVSRILWGLGYHQPLIYYLPSWRLTVGGEERRESEARFRPKLPQLKRLDEGWSWADNPFSGTRELKGLLVVLLILNSTDLKGSNNTVYALERQWDGAARWFVVRDLGAALGETGTLFPRRNWLAGFERESFITGAADSRPEFGYSGRHKELLDMIGTDDVRWAARQMARLTDGQWRDAFRAGNYGAPQVERYIHRIKEKIADGLAVRIDRRELDDE